MVKRTRFAHPPEETETSPAAAAAPDAPPHAVPSLSRARLMALRALHVSPCYGARMARLLGVSRSTATAHLEFLRAYGLASLARTEEGRPWKTYRLTEHGRELLRALRLVEPGRGE